MTENSEKHTPSPLMEEMLREGASLNLEFTCRGLTAKAETIDPATLTQEATHAFVKGAWNLYYLIYGTPEQNAEAQSRIRAENI